MEILNNCNRTFSSAKNVKMIVKTTYVWLLAVMCFTNEVLSKSILLSHILRNSNDKSDQKLIDSDKHFYQSDDPHSDGVVDEFQKLYELYSDSDSYRIVYGQYEDNKEQHPIRYELSSNEWSLNSGPWLDQFEDSATLEKEGHLMQGDDPGGLRANKQPKPNDENNNDIPLKCPVVGDDFDKEEACSSQYTCTNRSHCIGARQMCCFNGCLFTCTEGVRDSVVIDWLVEPLPIDASKSSSWLVHDEPPGCILEERFIPDGKQFSFQGHICNCNNGEVTCNVYKDEEDKTP